MLIEVEPPSPMRYLMGAAVMMIGVVLPVGYMMFRNKRVPSKQTDVLVLLCQEQGFDIERHVDDDDGDGDDMRRF
ncbi:hypothetical protein TanjilG_31398 [Lupinus angustifolius]|uniref:Uncharacterized protein n=1 Tax=Lupinus angustifolius TaxID=3871 RepID=A0A394DE64_LUPAN|nr:hypothetical protein TanjilG_31398 [Lupinus angustifolius]